MKIPKLKTKVHTLESILEYHLGMYEKLELRVTGLRSANATVFEEINRLEELKTETKETLKRLLYTKNGPPPETNGKMTHTWARGELFQVSVQYKKKHDYYDPNLVPRELLVVPGVIVEVDKDKLDALAEGIPFRRAQLDKALVTGEWMTPALSISRR